MPIYKDSSSLKRELVYTHGETNNEKKNLKNGSLFFFGAKWLVGCDFF